MIFTLRDFLASNDGLIGHSAYWGRDFINVWTGGHLIRDGRLSVLFDLPAYSAYQRSLFGDIGPHAYSYPPVSYPLAVIFSALPYWLALTTWTLSTGALFVVAARRWWPRAAGPVWLAVLTPAAIVNIWAGHYGFLIGALFLFGWRDLDEKPVRAGVFFGLLLLKPHLAVLIPVALLMRREWTAIASAAVTVVLLVLTTGLFFGWEAWHEFLFQTGGLQASLIDPKDMFFGMMSCSAATGMLRIGASWPLAIAVQTLFSAGAIAVVVSAAVKKVSTRDLALLTATSTFLLLPYSFNYDLTVVMIGALVLMTETPPASAQWRLGLYGFLSPQVGMVLSAFNLPLMPVALAGLAIAQFRHAMTGAAAASADLSPRDQGIAAFKKHTGIAS